MSNCRAKNDFQLDCVKHGWCCPEQWLQGVVALFKAVSASPTGAIGGSCVGGDVLGVILWSPVSRSGVPVLVALEKPY